MWQRFLLWWRDISLWRRLEYDIPMIGRMEVDGKVVETSRGRYPELVKWRQAKIDAGVKASFSYGLEFEHH